jgi:hypothetical protein
VDGSSVSKADVPTDPFEADIQKEMDRLQVEVLQEFKSSSSPTKIASQVQAQDEDPPPNALPSPPRFPSERPKPRDSNYGDLLRSQIEQDSMAKANSAQRFAPAAASPPRFPSEKAAAAKNNYGDLLRSQIAQDSIAKASHSHNALQADYEAKKQEVRTQKCLVL